MKAQLTYLLIFIVPSLISCNHDDEPKSSIIYGNSVIISSTDCQEISGYSLKYKGVITVTDESEIDLLLSTLFLANNNMTVPIGSFLHSPKLATGFFKFDSGGTPLDNDTFEAIKVVPESIQNWEKTPVIESGEIWFVKTSENKYGKLLFSEVNIDTDGQNILSSAAFKWIFQTDGTLTLK